MIDTTYVSCFIGFLWEEKETQYKQVNLKEASSWKLGQLSCCSVQGEAGPDIYEKSWLSIVLRFQHVWFLWPSVTTQSIDIITNPSYSKTMNTDHALTGSSSPDITWPQWQCQSFTAAWLEHQQDSWTPPQSQVSVQSLGICTALIGNRSHEHQPRCWLLLGPKKVL